MRWFEKGDEEEEQEDEDEEAFEMSCSLWYSSNEIFDRETRYDDGGGGGRSDDGRRLLVRLHYDLLGRVEPALAERRY